MTRIERILQKLILLHAPHLAPLLDQKDPSDPLAHVQRVAGQLAKHGILVIIAEMPEELEAQKQIIIEDWLASCVHLYDIVSKVIYPSLSEVVAKYADTPNLNPSIIVLQASSHAVLEGFGRYIMPYVGLRHRRRPFKTDEINDMLTAFLEFVGADNLAHRVYQPLHQVCYQAVCQIMNSPARQICLTDFDPALLEIIHRHGNTQPYQPVTPPTQAHVKQQEPLKLEQLNDDEMPDDTPSQQMFRVRLPIRADRNETRTERNEKSRRPPVPPLPKRNDDDESQGRK